MCSASTLVVVAILSKLAWYNLFFYALISFVIVLGVREAGKYIFINSIGGIYFGLW